MSLHRAIKDAGFAHAKALPAAAASNNSATFDLGAGGYVPENLEVEISIPAMSAHNSASYNVIILLQDSADDSSYATVTTPAISYTLPGVASTGSAATIVRFRLPAGIRRYVQFNQAVDTGGPTLTAKSVTYSLLF
jgi:hypothetical protein